MSTLQQTTEWCTKTLMSWDTWNLIESRKISWLPASQTRLCNLSYQYDMQLTATLSIFNRKPTWPPHLHDLTRLGYSPTFIFTHMSYYDHFLSTTTTTTTTTKQKNDTYILSRTQQEINTSKSYTPPPPSHHFIYSMQQHVHAHILKNPAILLLATFIFFPLFFLQTIYSTFLHILIWNRPMYAKPSFSFFFLSVIYIYIYILPFPSSMQCFTSFPSPFPFFLPFFLSFFKWYIIKEWKVSHDPKFIST